MTYETEQITKPLTPDQLPQTGMKLAGSDEAVIDLLPADKVAPDTEVISIDSEGGAIRGRQALNVRFEDGTETTVVDVRHTDAYSGVRTIGSRAAEGTIGVGENVGFVLITRRPEADRAEIKPLIAQQEVAVPIGMTQAQCSFLEEGVGMLRLRTDETVEATLYPPEQPYSQEKDHTKLGLDEAVELIGYADVLDGEERTRALEYVRNSPNGMKYAHTLVELVARHGTQRVMDVAAQLRDECSSILRQYETEYGLQPTRYAESISWALWDLAKQSYLARHPDEALPEYVDGRHGVSLDDPFTDDYSGGMKRKEIVNRHLGWELFMAKGQQLRVDPSQLLAMSREAFEWAWNGGVSMNHTGQPRSYELAKIGSRMRYMAELMPGGARYRDPTRRQRER